jgi:hypothetical protein
MPVSTRLFLLCTLHTFQSKFTCLELDRDSLTKVCYLLAHLGVGVNNYSSVPLTSSPRTSIQVADESRTEQG